jgi:2-polyprenyl-3-methyl-5-hydroxy-6-metoxy-1,4-benzoquinol methylase
MPPQGEKRAIKPTQSDQDLIRDVLVTCVCPICHGNLKIFNKSIACNDCKRVFPVVNGIPKFIADVHISEKITELSSTYDRAIFRHSGSAKSCGYSGNIGFISRLNVLRKWIDFDKIKGKKIIDIGCGTGLMTEQLAKKNEVWGVDISLGLLNIAREKGLKTLLASADFLPFNSNDFNMVICIGVIPYYKNPSKIFSEICRVTGPEGKMIVTSTANSFLVQSVRFIKNFFARPSQLAHLYTAKEIKGYLIQRGAKILGSCTCYNDKIYPLDDDRCPLRFKLLSLTNAVLAEKDAGDE